jgi:hypothetical protein
MNLGPEVLRLEEVPTPRPGPGQVLVRMHAIGVNPVETYIRAGTYAYKPALPYTPGNDGAGVVEQVGPDVNEFKPGDRAYTAGSSLSSTYAEFALCKAEQVQPLPEASSPCIDNFYLKPLARGCSNSRRFRARRPRKNSHTIRTRVDIATYHMAKRPAYFDSQAQAAAILKIDISDLREAKVEGCPAFRSGRVYTAPLLAWFAEKRRQRTDLAAADGMENQRLVGNSENDDELPKSHWDRKKARLDYERALYRFEVEKEKYVELNEITIAVGQMLVGFRTAINMLPANAARWLVGLRDFHQIKDKLQSEVDVVLNSLGRGDFLKTDPAEVIAKCLPFDAETEALLGKITLLGQDRAALYELIGRVAARTITEFGRLSLSDLLQRQLPLEDSR